MAQRLAHEPTSQIQATGTASLAAEGAEHLRSHLVAPSADRRSQMEAQGRRFAAVRLPHRREAMPQNAGCCASPTGVQEHDRAVIGIDDVERNAIGDDNEQKEVRAARQQAIRLTGRFEPGLRRTVGPAHCRPMYLSCPNGGPKAQLAGQTPYPRYEIAGAVAGSPEVRIGARLGDPADESREIALPGLEPVRGKRSRAVTSLPCRPSGLGPAHSGTRSMAAPSPRSLSSTLS